jgi:hypothetical protein
MSNSLDGHTMAKVLEGCEERMSARKKNQWQRRRSNELVNSKQ